MELKVIFEIFIFNPIVKFHCIFAYHINIKLSIHKVEIMKVKILTSVNLFMLIRGQRSRLHKSDISISKLVKFFANAVHSISILSLTGIFIIHFMTCLGEFKDSSKRISITGFSLLTTSSVLILKQGRKIVLGIRLDAFNTLSPQDYELQI